MGNKKNITLTVLHHQDSMVTSPRRSESRNATGGSPHSCGAKAFSLTFLKAYRGSFASVNKTKHKSQKK